MTTSVLFTHSRRRFFAVVAAAFGLSLLGTGHASAQSIPGVVIVKVNPGVDVHALATSYNGTVLKYVARRSIVEIAVPIGTESSTMASMGNDARVFYSEGDPGTSVPPPPVVPFGFDGGISLSPVGTQTAFAQINYGTTASITTGAGVVVAVIDTGSTPSHPALQGHLLTGYNAISPSSLPLDVPDSTSNVAVGHGTMVSGIIAATAPGAQILPVKVLAGDGSGTTAAVIDGISWAVANGANVINMSFGAPNGSRSLREAVADARAAGVVLVASVGNSGSETMHYPAAYKDVIAVASVESNNVLSTYSNYGSFVDVVAPGTNIVGTYVNGGYAYGTGTSFAAPFVSGEAALIEAAFPNYNAKKVIRHISDSATSVDSVNPNFAGLLGDGLISIQAALTP